MEMEFSLIRCLFTAGDDNQCDRISRYCSYVNLTLLLVLFENLIMVESNLHLSTNNNIGHPPSASLCPRRLFYVFLLLTSSGTVLRVRGTTISPPAGRFGQLLAVPLPPAWPYFGSSSLKPRIVELTLAWYLHTYQIPIPNFCGL